VGYDILSKHVLVVDIGSSTTDFAYIMGGREVELQTAGEVALGGGLMDEVLLEIALDAAVRGERIREIFKESPPWRSYCEFAARRLKEKYFADEEYWKENEQVLNPLVRTGKSEEVVNHKGLKGVNDLYGLSPVYTSWKARGWL
jgi:hypothetical protein